MKLANWDGKLEEVHDVLTAAFCAEDYLECITDLRARHIEPSSYIDCLDKVSSHSIQKHHTWPVTIR